MRFTLLLSVLMLATACKYISNRSLLGKWQTADGKQIAEFHMDGTVVMSSPNTSLQITAHYKLLTTDTAEIELPSRIQASTVRVGTNSYIRNLDIGLGQIPKIIVRFSAKGDSLTLIGDKNTTNVLKRIKS